jgi:transposase InsO family protein
VTDLHARDAKRYPVSVLCGLLGVSKQAYYKRDENAELAKAAQEDFALQYIHQIRLKDPGIGGMKLWHMYRREFSVVCPMGRDRFEDLIDRWGLKVRRRVRAPRTTDSSHGLPTYPNLIRDFIPTARDQLWVSDITYITVWLSETSYIFCYLSLVMDAYTEEIIGWSVGETLDAVYPLKALRMALKRIEGKVGGNLIHHSDRGCQYASSEYVKLLASNDIHISMTENGDPKENAQAERVNGTIKNELFKGRKFRSVTEVRAAVSDAVTFYNNERPHMSIGMMTPVEASNHTGELEKKWKSYRLAAIKKKAENDDITEKGLPLPRCQRSLSGLHSTVNL